MHVPAGLYVPLLVQGWVRPNGPHGTRNETLIKRLARIESLAGRHVPQGLRDRRRRAGRPLALPLADIIDVDAEKARLDKTLGKLGKEIGGLRGRLDNPKFAESAPEDVVEEVRVNLAAREAEEAQLRQAMARLEEIG